MCGIIGYLGNKPAAAMLIEGLERLEYRGYDSAGLALVDENGELSIRRAVGRLDVLKAALAKGLPSGTVGIGHTRWATHGKPSVANAHPHTDCRKEVAVIHNGIVENYRVLRERLENGGHHFTSQTDTEVLPHLLEENLARGVGLAQALRLVAREIQGANCILAICQQEPQHVVGVRTGNAGGIVVGYGQEEMWLASDLPALLSHTRRVVFLTHGEMVQVTRNSATYFSLDGQTLTKEPRLISYDPTAAAKGGYKHFMLKEIMEQAEVVTDAISGRVDLTQGSIRLEDLPWTTAELKKKRRVVLVGCGTSFHAALVTRTYMERLAGLPAEAEAASEFRYREPYVDSSTLLISIAQSGETADTLAAMEEGKRRNTPQITICNVEGSQAPRVADATVFMRAGPEIGVAATKTFTASLTSLYLLAIYMGLKRGFLGRQRAVSHLDDLARLPHQISQLLQQSPFFEHLAHQFYRNEHFLYLGRGIQYPIALEGALKLKEISYIHAEGYPAGEMKHGPIALINEDMPVVAIAMKDGVYEKMFNNIEEAKARDGKVIALGTEGDNDLKSHADHVIYVPQSSPLLAPILTTIPLQLFAYHIAVRRGCDVDQPRNLAKTVTVE